MSEFKNKCDEMGDILYDFYKSQKPDLENLSIEWAKDRFWGRVVNDHIPIFRKLYTLLENKGCVGEKNCYIYNDLDCRVWIEKADGLKVIVSSNHASLADTYKYLFILKDWEFGYFRIATVWDREKKSRGFKRHQWGDMRDIDIPSLNTHRKEGFRWGYQDCRDKGHVLKYEFYNKNVDKSCASESFIPHSLDLLKYDLSAIENNEGEKRNF